MAVTIQDRYIGITKLEAALQYVNYDKRTPVTAADIAQFIDEYYPELFEGIAKFADNYSKFNYTLEIMRYHSFAEIAADMLADGFNGFKLNMHDMLAIDYGYDSLEEMEENALVICDNAIDGFLVILP